MTGTDQAGGEEARPARVSHPGVTDDMVERAAQSLSDKIVEQSPPPGYLRAYARDALEAALAGRTVVELPKPDEDSMGKFWCGYAGHEYYGVVRDGRAYVSVPYGDEPPDEAEADALAKLAAAREARRLAAEEVPRA